MRKQLSLAVAVVGLITLLATAMVGCGQSAQAPAVDSSKKVIKVGWLTDLTGPSALSCTPMVESGMDMLQEINAKGGILGHPVEYVIVDTKYDTNLAVTGFEKLCAQDNVWCATSQSANFPSVCKPLTERYKVPLSSIIEYGTVLPVSQNQYLFGNGPTYADYYRCSLNWIKDNWKKADPPRIAIMGVDMAFSKSNIKGVKWMLENELKWPIVATEWMSMSSTNATSQVTNIKNANPDYIVLCSAGNPQIIFHKTAKAMGLTDTAIIIDTFLCSIPMFRMADKDAMTGVITHIPVAIYPQMADEVPMLKEIAAIHKKNRPGTPFDWVRVSAYAGALSTIDGLTAAIEKYGFENVNGEKIKEIWETDLTGKTAHGLGAPGQWSTTDHIWCHDCIIAKTTETYDVEILYKWYHMPPWPSIAGDPGFWQ
ncbi:MAG: ABC transporter substrate-binding protein [Dehalococcoidia bacterium]|nr:MAG: ABC transporter substrate-binding protein [Dehalococcoidia bacterium]